MGDGYDLQKLSKLLIRKKYLTRRERGTPGGGGGSGGVGGRWGLAKTRDDKALDTCTGFMVNPSQGSPQPVHLSHIACLSIHHVYTM